MANRILPNAEILAQPEEWTPCWSAHYYGFPTWGDDCSCTDERKAALRERGKAAGYTEDRYPFALPEKRDER